MHRKLAKVAHYGILALVPNETRAGAERVYLAVLLQVKAGPRHRLSHRMHRGIWVLTIVTATIAVVIMALAIVAILQAAP